MRKNSGNPPVQRLNTLINHIHKQPSDSIAERIEVYESFKGLVHSRVRKFCYPGSSTFEDCVQEAYVGLARAIDRFDTSRGIQFSTFASTIIDRRLIDFLNFDRRSYDGALGRRVTIGEPDEDGNTIELDELASVESFEKASIWAIDTERLRSELRTAVRDLPVRQQEAVRLFFEADLPKADIAVAMNVSRPRVTVLLDDAIRGLRRRMRIGS